MARTPKTSVDTAAQADELKRETDKVTSKIDAAIEKLAIKYRDKSEEAKAKLADTKGKAKRAVLLRRFELYGDAAHLLEARFAERNEKPDGD